MKLRVEVAETTLSGTEFYFFTTSTLKEELTVMRSSHKCERGDKSFCAITLKNSNILYCILC